MRNKARLSITGSTGENGRVMTPEFPKAVHAVPYVRPDMGLNVSLTDLSWSTRNFWVPYNGFNLAIPFSFQFFFFFFGSVCLFVLPLLPQHCPGAFTVSVWWSWKGDEMRWRVTFSPLTKNCVPALCCLSPCKPGAIASRESKRETVFLNWWHRAFLSVCVSVCLDGTETGGKKRTNMNRAWLTSSGCFWEPKGLLSDTSVRWCAKIKGTWGGRCRQQHALFL